MEDRIFFEEESINGENEHSEEDVDVESSGSNFVEELEEGPSKIESFYSEEELDSIGLKSYGENVLISRKASLYGPENMEIGNNVRIDDFCLLSGEVKLGSYIHIGAYSALYGKAGIYMEDYSGLSSRCTIFSVTDDYGGDYLIGPTMPSEALNIIEGSVIMRKYTTLGAGAIVLPGVEIAEGSVVGSMSLVNKDLDSWGIYMGIPAKFLKRKLFKF